jgi:spermidine synthase
VGLLIGFEIPIVARIAAERSAFRKAIADVLSLDYVGALLGALLFPLVLLPSFGFTATSFVIGLANVLVAAANLFSFWGQLRRPRVLVIATLLVGAALMVGLIAAPDLRAAIEAKRR